MYQIVLVTFVNGEHDKNIALGSYNKLLNILNSKNFISNLHTYNLGDH